MAIYHALLSILILAIATLASSPNTNSVAHFTLGRRGGRLAEHEAANLTRLAALLRETEAKYSRTIREVKGNKLSRRWKSRTVGSTVDHELVNAPGQPGRWFVARSASCEYRFQHADVQALHRFFNLPIGDQPSFIEVDLDMLGPDFYTLLTTSEHGSRYNSFSSSHGKYETRTCYGV